MENPLLKKILPHIIAIVLMFVMAIAMFSPYVFDGRVLDQNDIVQAGSAQAEIDKYKAIDGKEPLWTNSYFAGMPTYQIHQEINGNLLQTVFRASLLGQPLTAPHTSVLLAMLCMYLLLNVIRIDWRLSLIGAFVFGLSTFNMDIIAAGHSTKMIALAYTPGVLAGMILAFRGRYLLGSAVFGLFFALQVFANHYQIPYYTAMIGLIWAIAELILAARSGALAGLAKATGALVFGLALAVLCNLTTIWTTQEYQTESTRGKTELSAAKKTEIQQKNGAATSNSNGGLSKDYAFGWSLGIGETMTLLVQNSYGGGGFQDFSDLDIVRQGVPAGALYYGDQPFVGVAIYYGAVIIFLFILGLILVENRWRWTIFASALLMLGIAWGKNSPIGHLLYDTMPLFSKFRAHTQALGLGQMLFVVLAMLAVQRFLDPLVSSAKKQRALLVSTGITVVLCIIATMGDFSGAIDARVAQQNPEMVPVLKEARSELARADAMRSLFLVLLAAGLLFTALRGWLTKTMVIVALLGVVIFGDIWTAARRIMYEDKFQEPKKFEASIQPSPADQLIMKDKDPHFRVLDLSEGANFFENAKASRFHKSVGGYHAAKMMNYQEMVEAHLGSFDPKTPINMQKNMPLFGMLNAKYIILSPEMTGVQPNPAALGNAWFVRSVRSSYSAKISRKNRWRTGC
jgi:hypothetical protein